MKLRELVAAIYVPYRNVAYGLMIFGSIVNGIFSWCFIKDAVTPNLYWICYVAILLMFIGIMYLTFWVYKAGYKKRALLMAIAYVALFAISIIIITWAFHSHTAIQPLLP